MRFNQKYTLGVLSAFYFLTRLVFLTKLPIFNDEAIYLDWANRIIQGIVSPFYSLYDGTQPGLLWIFGVFTKVFPDPLVAGRFVSVLFGLTSMLGLYKLSARFVSQKVARLSALFYIVTPLFVFYDRQALMESAIASVGIWSIYFLARFLENFNSKFMVFLGILLGIGFFIKSSAAIFLVPLSIIGFISFFRVAKRRKSLFLGGLIFAALFSLVISPLFFQEQAKIIYSGSNRYIMTLGELARFPLITWTQSFRNALEILTWHVFPTTLLLAVFGVFISFKRKKKDFSLSLFLLWFLLSTLAVLIIAKQVQSRYLVAFTPLVILPAAKGIFFIPKKLRQVVVISAVLMPLAVTLILIFKPDYYLKILSEVTTTSDVQTYVYGFPSGYGIKETRAFLEEKAKTRPILVGVRLDSGNPESAMFTYYGPGKNPRLRSIYFDRRILVDIPPELEYIELPVPLYFVSREENLAGLDKYLVEVARFYKPDNIHFIGVYTLKKQKK